MTALNFIVIVLVCVLAALGFGPPPDPNPGPVVVVPLLAHNEQGGLRSWSIAGDKASTSIGVHPLPSAAGVSAAFSPEAGAGVGQVLPGASYRAEVVVWYDIEIIGESGAPPGQGLVRFQGVDAASGQGEMGVPASFDAVRTNLTSRSQGTVVLPLGSMSGDAAVSGVSFQFQRADPLSDTRCKVSITMRLQLWRE